MLYNIPAGLDRINLRFVIHVVIFRMVRDCAGPSQFFPFSNDGDDRADIVSDLENDPAAAGCLFI